MRNIFLPKGIVLGCLMISALFARPGWAADLSEENKMMPLELDGSKWAIEITLVEKSGKKGTSSLDTLIFEKKQFFSEESTKKGYEPSNYSVSLEGDGATKFGTMQNKDMETTYWEGRIKDETINGSIYVYSKKAKGIKKEYYFNGTLSSGALKPKNKPDPVVDKKVEIAPAKASEPIMEE